MLADARAAGQLSRLILTSRLISDRLLQGEVRSHLRGQAVEFADYEEYRPGMDLRNLDWRVWARTDRRVVRRYEIESEIPLQIIVDFSADTGTGNGSFYPEFGGSKKGYIAVLAATLLWVAWRKQIPVGLEIWNEKRLRYSLTRERSGISRMWSSLMEAPSSGRASIGLGLQDIGRTQKGPTRFVLISDMMEEPKEWLPSLRVFHARRCDFTVFQVFDSQEWSFDYKDPKLFYSPETGGDLPIDPPQIKALFLEVAKNFEQELRQAVVSTGGNYFAVPTHRSVEEPLLGWITALRGRR